MRFATIILLIVVSFTKTLSQSLDWANSVGDAALQEASDLVTDASGALFVAGSFEGDVDFDPGAGVDVLTAAPGIKSGYFAKYDETGAHQFAWALSSTAEVAVQTITLDATGNIIVAGTFLTDLDVDPTAAVDQLLSAGTRAVFVAKYDPTGNLIWGEAFDCTGNVAIGDVATDGTNIYVTGHYQGQITIATPLTSAAGADIFFAKLDGNGAVLLEGSYGQALDQIAYGIVALPSEEFFISGIYSNGVDFGNGITVSENSSVSGFLAKFDASGVAQDAITLGGIGNQVIVTMEKDASDNLLLAGHIQQEVVLDGSTTLNIIGVQADDIFIAKYDDVLALQWGEVIGSDGASNNHVVKKLTSDQADRVYLQGEFAGVLAWDPQNPGTTQAALGNQDLFVSVLDKNGNFNYGFQIGGAGGAVTAAGVAASSSEELLLHGNFDAASVDFNPDAGTQNLPFSGIEDVFFMNVTLPDVTGPASPTVDLLSTNAILPTLTGTYDDTDGALVDVEVNGVTYLETGPDLTAGPGANWTLVIPAGNELTEGSYDVTVTAEDPLSNPTVETIVDALIVDLTLPTITLNGAATVWLLQNTAYTDLGVVATDDVDGDISGSVVVDASAVDASTPGSYSVTYDVSDAAGNAAIQVTRTVEVIPEPLVCNDQVLYRINVGGAELAASDAGPAWSIDLNGQDASPFRIGNGGTNLFGVSNGITIDYSLVPAAAVDDIFLTERWDPPGGDEMKWEFPVETGTDVTVSLLLMEGFSGNTDPGDRVFDVSVEGAVPAVFDDIDPVGSYGTGVAFILEHTYTATDDVLDLEFLHDIMENPTVRGIQVCGVDLTAPVITLIGDDPKKLLVGEAYVEEGATAIDNLTGDVSGDLVIDASNVNTSIPGSYQVTYNVVDAAGNAAIEVIRTVEVEELELPLDCENVLFRVNAGGPTIANNDGKLDWSGDTGNFPNVSNSPYLTQLGGGNTIFLGTAGPAHPGPIIGGDPTAPGFIPLEVFNSERFDQVAAPTMRWEFPIVTGTEVQATLLFAELFGQIDLAGERSFSVEIEGSPDVQMANIDPVAIAGPKGAFTRSTTVQVDDGTLEIEFVHGVENPAIKGFQVCAVKWVPTVDQLVTNDPNPTLTGTTSFEAGETFIVEFEGVVYDLDTDPELTRNGIVWSLDLSGIAPLTDGSYSVIATRVDTDAMSIVDVSDLELEVDTQAPSVPTVQSQITNNATPMLVGTAEIGTDVSVSVGGAIYEMVADAGGNWTVDTGNDTPASGTFSPNTNGVNQVVVTSTDEAGNSTTDATNDELAIDIVLPPIPTVNILLTNDPTPVLEGTAEAATTVTVIVAGATYTTTADGGGMWTVDTENDIPVGAFIPDVNGSNEVTVTSTDAASNSQSDVTSDELTIDTTFPTIPTVLSQLTGNATPLLAGTADDGTTVTVEVGGATYTTTGDASNSWTVNTNTDVPSSGVFAPDENGPNEVVVTSTDPAGNASVDVSTNELILDTTPPAAPTIITQVTNNPNPIVSGNAEASSAITVGVGGATYQTLADGGGNWSVDTDTDVPSSGVFNPDVNGPNEVEVTSTDAAGNSAADETNNELTIDTIFPAVPTVNAQLTDDPTPVLSGTAEVASDVTVDVGGATYETVADGVGSWSVDTESAVPTAGVFAPDENGVNEVNVTSTDAAGNATLDATTNELTIDTTFPAVPTIVSQLTNDVTPELVGTAEAGTTVAVVVAGATYETTADGSNQWMISTESDVPTSGAFLPDTDGDNEVVVSSTDAAGNTTFDLTTNELAIDAVAPAIPTIVPLITNDPTPIISGTAEAASTVSVQVAGATYNTIADGSDTWSIDTETDIPVTGVFSPDVNGPNEVAVTSTDAATNSTSDVTTDELTIDTTFPIAPTAVAQLTNDITPLLAGTAEAATTVVVVVAGATYQTVADISDSWTVNVGTETPVAGTFAPDVNGPNDVAVTSTDAAGNATSDLTTNELTIDTTPPSVPTVVSQLTNDPLPTLEGTAEANSTISVTVGGAVFSSTTDGSGNWVIETDTPIAGTFTPDLNGANEVVATSTDGAGNSSVDTSSDELVIDTTNPVVPTVDAQITNDVTPMLMGTAEAGTTVFVEVAGATFSTIADGSSNWSIDTETETPVVGVFSPNVNGANEVVVTSTDAATNSTSDATVDELTIDTVFPVAPTAAAQLTNDITPLLTGTAESGTTVLVQVAGATFETVADGSDSWTVNVGTETPILGTFAPDVNGPNDVAVTSTDAAGNATSDLTTDELTIDTTPPAIPTVVSQLTNDPSPVLQGTAEANSPVSVAVGGAVFLSVTDGSGNWVLDTETEAPVSGVYAPDLNGANEVTATNTDGAGNSSVDTSSDELVIDTTSPAVPTVISQMTNDVTPVLNGTADVGAALSVTVAGATYAATVDGLGNWSIDLGVATPTSGAFAPNVNGLNDVVLTSTDDANNSSTDTTTDELVIDTTPPVVSVNSLITNDETPALDGSVDDIAATISVNVDGADYPAINNGDGTWSLPDNSVANLNEGILEVVVTATDLASNDGVDASTGELNIDLTSPVVSIDPLLTSDATPLVSGTVDTPDATIEVTVNGLTYAGVNQGATWFAQVTDFLNDGVYNISASATDVAGNVGSDVSDDELTLEGGARIPTVTVDAVEGFDFTPALSGTVDDELAIIDVTVDGVTYRALNDGNGAWAIGDNVINDLPVGTYDVLVEATSPSDLVGTDNTGGELRILPRTTTLNDPTDVAVNSYNVSWQLLEGGVATYIVEVSESEDFSTIITSFQELEGEDSFVAVTGLAYNTTYYTRAKVIYQSGDVSDYSSIVQARTLTDPDLSLDSLTLITIYEATGGAAWNNTTNWKEGRVDTWHGVTVEDGRVTRLDFAGNNLIGAIGDITDSFSFLISMDLSDNKLTDIGDLSELTNLQIADVSRNRLPFGAFQHLQATGAQVLYEGQGLLLEPITLLVEQGAEFLFDREISGAGNVYTWFKNDALIAPTQSSYTVDVNSFDQEGAYYAQVTNPDFPGVTLRTNTITLKVSSVERDRESLLAIWEATGGADWTNGADWPNNPNMDSWVGVTVENNRVTELDLANSNLTGEVPNDLLDVVNLAFLDISGNSITRIPDLRSLESLTAPDVSDNLLDFGDLEGNAEIPSINYQNQRPFGEATEIHFVKGSDPTLSVAIGGSSNKYEWLFRGVVTDQEISVATTETHTVTDLQYLNMGEYFLQVTNPLVPGLTLISEPQTILATIDVRLSATYSDSDGKTHILDEGVGALLMITQPGQPFDTVDVREVVNEELVFENVVLGDYIVALRTDTLILKPNSLGELDSICLLPTYFRSTFLWEDAERLVVRNQVVEEMVMQQKPLNVDIGDNVVRLLVESDFVDGNNSGARIQARRTVKRAGCSLRRRRRATGGRGESDGEVYDLVAYRETDENGRVTFQDLPDGYYRLNIEYPGIPMDPTSFVEFQIGDEGLEQNTLTLEATVDETGIEVELVEILKVVKEYFEDVSIYPNPAYKDLNIAYAGLRRDGIVMQMMDLQGRLLREEEVKRSQENIMTMDVSDMENGLYLLRFVDASRGEGIVVFKVRIQR